MGASITPFNLSPPVKSEVTADGTKYGVAYDPRIDPGDTQTVA